MHKRIIVISLLIAGLGLCGADRSVAAGLPVYLVRLTGAITPANADYLESAIFKANTEGAGCLIVLLDTPGGLSESMRKMVMAIYGSVVPVVVYVSPSGARAAT